MSEELFVYLREERVGRLALEPNARYSFTYDPAWCGRADAMALSLSLPVAAEAYSYDRCRPFFGGLLPEGNVRVAVARRHGVSPASKHHQSGGGSAGRPIRSRWTPASLG